MQKEKYLGNLEQERKESNEERLKATSNKYVILTHNSYTFQVFSFAWDKHSGASKAYMKSPTRMQLDSMQSTKKARSQHHYNIRRVFGILDIQLQGCKLQPNPQSRSLTIIFIEKWWKNSSFPTMQCMSFHPRKNKT